MKKMLFIDRKKFILWVYATEEDEKRLTEYVINELLKKGKVSLKDTDLLNEIPYIPLDFIVNAEDINKNDTEYESTLEAPENYILRFKNK